MDGLADTNVTRARDGRIDALRGIAIILVILHHLQPWSGIRTAFPYLWAFNWEVTLLGVPLFYLVSLYLLAQRADRGTAYFIKRVLRVVLLYLVFATTQAVVYVLIHHAAPPATFYSLVNGGPDLPVVGQSVFFFLFDLAVLIVALWAYLQLPIRVRTIAGVVIVIATAILFEAVVFGRVGVIPHYSPLNYVIYVPLAAWLASGRVRVARLWPALTVAYLVLVAQNLVLRSDFGFSLDIGSRSLYGRLSLPFGAMAIMTAALSMKPRPVPALGPAGRYSLGLFALHKYAWYVVAALLGGLSLPYRTEVLPLVTTAVAVVLTCWAVWVLSVSPLLRPLVAESGVAATAMAGGGAPGAGRTSSERSCAGVCRTRTFESGAARYRGRTLRVEAPTL